MTEKNISQELRMKERDVTGNYVIEEIKQNELISKNLKKIYKILD